jgi:hypothetical protein
VGPRADLRVLSDLMLAELDFDVSGVFDDGVWELTQQTRHEARPFLKVGAAAVENNSACDFFLRQKLQDRRRCFDTKVLLEMSRKVCRPSHALHFEAECCSLVLRVGTMCF